MAQVLVIEDERDVADVIEYNLRIDGHVPSVVGTAEDGLRLARDSKPDLVLLDLMLPDRPGTEVCRIMKESDETRNIPIIIVTARTDEIDRVVGFELGADDYVTKPFSVRELLLRIKRTLQRRVDLTARSGTELENEILHIDRAAHRVLVDRREVELSLLEFRILETLVEHRGRVMTRDTLLKVVWGQDCTVSQRTIDAHIKRLRDRLGMAGAAVETVRGVGYRFATISGKSDSGRLVRRETE